MFLWFYFLLLATASGATGGDVRSRHAGPAPPGPCFNTPDLPGAGSPTSLFVEADAKLKCLHDDAEAKCSDADCKEIDEKLVELEKLMVQYRALKIQWAELFDSFKEKTEAFRSDQENRKKHEEEGLKDIKEALGMFSVAYTKHQAALAGIKGGGAVVPHAAPSVVTSPEPSPEDDALGPDQEGGGEHEEDDSGNNPSQDDGPPPPGPGGEISAPEREGEGENDEDSRREEDDEPTAAVGLKKSCADEPFNCVEKTRAQSGNNELCVNRNRCSIDEEKGCERPECKCQKAQCQKVCGDDPCDQRGYTKTGAQQETFWVCGDKDEDPNKKDAPLKDCDDAGTVDAGEGEEFEY